MDNLNIQQLIKQSVSMRLIDCFSPLISLALHGQTASNVQEIESLHGQLMSFVEQSRQTSEDRGYTEKQCDSALFAVVAWIDERNLCNPDVGNIWVHLQLQKTLFNTTSAGDEFFERFTGFSEQDSELLDVYRTCLSLGFRGRMYDDQEVFDEFCLDNFGCHMAGVTDLLPAPLFAQAYEYGKKKHRSMRGIGSSALQSFFLLLTSLALLGGMYFFCQRSLESLYISLNSMGL